MKLNKSHWLSIMNLLKHFKNTKLHLCKKSILTKYQICTEIALEHCSTFLASLFDPAPRVRGICFPNFDSNNVIPWFQCDSLIPLILGWTFVFTIIPKAAIKSFFSSYFFYLHQVYVRQINYSTSVFHLMLSNRLCTIMHTSQIQMSSCQT